MGGGAPGLSHRPRPVSYTHLDVYKRQVQPLEELDPPPIDHDDDPISQRLPIRGKELTPEGRAKPAAEGLAQAENRLLCGAGQFLAAGILGLPEIGKKLNGQIQAFPARARGAPARAARLSQLF